MAMTNAELQRAYRERKREQGLRDRLFYVTEEQEKAIKDYLAHGSALPDGGASGIRGRFQKVDLSALTVSDRLVLETRARKVWKEGYGGAPRRDLETVRQVLQEIDDDNPAWGFREVKELIGVKRDLEVGEMARAVAYLSSTGRKIGEIGEILKSWGER